jgi:hypothetical protein
MSVRRRPASNRIRSWNSHDAGGRLLPGVTLPATWSPDRVRYAVLGVLVATLTAAIVVGMLGPGSGLYGLAYVGLAVLAVFFPAAVTAQVVGGQALVGLLFLVQDGAALTMAVPLVATVVVTAELLAVVALLDTAVPRGAGDALARTGRASALAGAVFAGAILLSAVPGPTGILAVGLGSMACLALAVRMARTAS